MKPKILEFATELAESSIQLPYRYDFERSLNVVTVEGETEPFINSDVCLNTQTKTRVAREQDDRQITPELATKTKIQKESDDFSVYLGLKTKTFVKNERDD
jgi:hypothetical protein